MSSDNKRHYVLNILSTYGTTAASLIIGILSAPISLNYWKPELYGINAIVGTFVSYLSISGLGIDSAAGILMTKTNSLADKRAILHKSLFLIVGFISFTALSVFVAGRNFPQWVGVIGKISSENVIIARQLVAIYVVSFLLNIPLSTISNSYAAYQKTYISHLYILINSVSQFLILLLAIARKRSLVEYTALSVTVALCINLTKILTYKRIVKHYVPLSSNDVEQGISYRQILITGIRLSFYGTAVMLISSAGNLVISNILGAARVAVYYIVMRIVTILVLCIQTLNTSMAPLLGKEYASQNWTWIERVHKSLFSSTVILSGLLCYGCMFFLRDIVFVWVGRSMDPGVFMAVIIGFWAFSACLSNLNYVVINSFNYTKGIGFISWSELALFVLSSVLLTKRIDIAGVPAGMFLGSLLTTQWMLPLSVWKRSGKHLTYDFRLLAYVLGLVLIAIPVVCFQQNRVSTWYVRVLIGVICVGGYVVATFRLLPTDIRGKIKTILLHRS